MSAIVIKEGLVHYEALGRGEPLVFVHGWLGSWRYWVPAMEELSINHRAYALDLWGFGDSDKLDVRYNVDAYIEMLKIFLDKQGLQEVSLVGHALGGVVALLFADKYPDRVERVMGVSVPLWEAAVNRPLASFSGNGGALERLVSRLGDYPEVNLEARKADAQAVSASARSAMERDLRRILFPYDIHVLLVHGQNDPLIQPPQSDWMRDFAENVRVVSIDDTQHFPMLEERNKFNRLLMEFLSIRGDLGSLELKEEWQRPLR